MMLLMPKTGYTILKNEPGRNLDVIMQSYADAFDKYDEWDGLDSADPTSVHYRAEDKWFFRPDDNMDLGAYSARGRAIAYGTTSMSPFLRGGRNGLVAHELGHNYDAYMNSAKHAQDVHLLESRNLVYAYNHEANANQPVIGGVMNIDRDYMSGAGVPSTSVTDADYLERMVAAVGWDGFKAFNR
ncbi:hypothetical protein JT358_12950 [Micrococcales bacterium 31B]|nr:hypothetical protein [Micrococcales bacterium 31B]